MGPRSLKVIRVLEKLVNRIPTPKNVTVEKVGAITVRVHRPANPGKGPLPGVLWIHGGGYVMGLALQDDKLCRDFADRLGAVVVTLDYRCAPEDPYPAALDDCHDALVWLAARPDVDGSRIAIGGASAGGGLAAALAIAARERGAVAPVFQLLTYPMLDDRTALRRGIDERQFRMWNNKSNLYGWRSYLGAQPGSAGIPATAAPSRAEDLTGLPPAWIGVGTNDLFHDEDLEYAKRLEEAGVPCEVEVVDGAFHAFDLAVWTEVVKKFRSSQVAAFAEGLGITSPESPKP